MAEGEAAVASAAAPAQENSSSTPELASHAPSEPSNTLKRKQSPEPAHTSEAPSKKPRLSPDPTAGKSAHEDGETQQPSPPADARVDEAPKDDATVTTSAELAPESHSNGPAKHTTSPPPPTRRKSQPIDERKRGRRLFGAILGTLGQNASPALTRRRDIDLKQREKQRSTVQEDDGAREARLARLAEARRVEQRRYEQRGMRIRHANMRATARALRTETEPKLYYRPWQLRPEEEERIERQVREVEEKIEREERAWEGRDGDVTRRDEAGRDSAKEGGDADKRDDKMEEDDDPIKGDISDRKEEEKPAEEDRSGADDQKVQDTDNDGRSAGEQRVAEEPGKTEEDVKAHDQQADETVPSRRDDSDEEQDVDGDDAVIY